MIIFGKVSQISFENSFSHSSQSLYSVEILHLECLVFFLWSRTVQDSISEVLSGCEPCYACSCELPLPTTTEILHGGSGKVRHSSPSPQLSMESSPSRLMLDLRSAECPVTIWRKSVLEIFSRNNSKLHPFLSFPSHWLTPQLFLHG